MKKFFFVSIASVVILANAQVATVLGCAIDLGDPWFNVKAEVIDNPLSDVLDISFSPNAELVTFTNKSLKSDLYIASKDTDGKYPGYNQAQKDYRPSEKIIGHDFDPNVRLSVKDGIPQSVGVFHGGWGHADIGHPGVDIPDSGTVTLNQALDSTDNYVTKQVVNHKRPANVSIPKPDHQTMYAFYQDARYDIKIVLNYSLNNAYSSEYDDCGDPSPNRSGTNTNNLIGWFFPTLISLMLAAIATYSIFTIIKQRSKKKNTLKKNTRRKKIQ